MKKLVIVSWLLLAACAFGAGLWDGLGEDPLGPNGEPVAGNGGGSEFVPFPHKGQPTPRRRGPGAVDIFVSTNNQTYEGFPGARSVGLKGYGGVKLRLMTDDPYDPRIEIIGAEYNETNTITIRQGDYDSGPRRVDESPVFELPEPPNTFEETNTVTLVVPNKSTDSQPVSNSPSFTLPDPTLTFSSGGSSETKKLWDSPEFRYVSPPNPDDYADWLWATNMDGATANIYAYIGNREDVTVPEYLNGYKVVSLDSRYRGPESVAAWNRAKGQDYDFKFSSSDTFYPWAEAWLRAHPGYTVIVDGSPWTRAQVRALVLAGDGLDGLDEDTVEAVVDDYLGDLAPAGGSGGDGPSVRSTFPQYYGNSLNVDNGFNEGFGYNYSNQSVFAWGCGNAVLSGDRQSTFSPTTLRWDGHAWPFGGYGFAHTEIKEVYMPHVYWVGQYAFANCSDLASARFPELRGKVGTLAFTSTRDLSVLDLGFVDTMPGRIFAAQVANASNLQIWVDGPRPSWTTNKTGGLWTTTGFDKGPAGIVTHYRRGMPGWDEEWRDDEKLVDGPGFFGMRPAVAEATTFEEPGGWGSPDGASGDWYVSSNKLGAVGNVWLTGNEGSLRLEAPAFDPYGCARRLRVWDMGNSPVLVKGAANEALVIVGPGEVREFVWGGDASSASRKWRVLGQIFTDPLGFGDNVFGATEAHPETDLSTLQYVIAIGAGALSGGGGHTGVAAVGHYAGKDSTNLQWTTLLGNEAGARSKGLYRASAVGPMTFDSAEGVSNSAAIGVWAGANASFVSNQVFIDAHDIGAENNRGGTRGGAGTRDAEPTYNPEAAAIWVDDGDVYLGRDPDDPFFQNTYKGRKVTDNVNHLRGNWVVDGTLLDSDSEEYYCRWNASNASETNINWIPTNGWPSRKVQLFVTPPAAFTNFDVGIRAGWEPDEDLWLTLIWTRSNSGEGGQLFIGTNLVYTVPTGSVRRRIEMRWKAAFKRWISHVSTLEYRSDVFRSDGKGNDAIPTDGFLPEFE